MFSGYIAMIYGLCYTTNKYKACSNHPRIMATYEKPYGEAEYIHIDDIMVEDKEIGMDQSLWNISLNTVKRRQQNIYRVVYRL